MKLELENIAKINCPHCFCIDDIVETGSKIEKDYGDCVLLSKIMTPHKKCCNCGARRLIKESSNKE